MFCLKCGYELPDDANFCLKCGVSLKTPLHEQKKRIGIVDIAVRDNYFNISSTEQDIVNWCKQQILTMGYNGKYFDCPQKRGYFTGSGPLQAIPGRYYFLTEVHEYMGGKNSKIFFSFARILQDGLITEGWKKEANQLRYLKEI